MKSVLELSRSSCSVQVIARIEALDLEPIMVKLMDESEGEGWSLERAQTEEKWYKRFLCLNAIYPNRSIVPTKSIDTFWHYHILDTEKYAEDCQGVFGYFLHHFPYFGLRGEEDRKNLVDASKETWDLFRSHFAEEPPILQGGSRASICDSTPSCSGTGCTGGKCGPGNMKNRERPRLANLIEKS